MSTSVRVIFALLGFSFFTSTTLPILLPGARGVPLAARQAPDFKKQNGLDAQKLNAKFATLRSTDSCTDGENGCVEGGFGQCVGEKWVIKPCGVGQLQCFALPLVNAPGTTITCDTTQDAGARFAAAGVDGGVDGTGSNSTSAPLSFASSQPSRSVTIDTSAPATAAITSSEAVSPSITRTATATVTVAPSAGSPISGSVSSTAAAVTSSKAPSGSIAAASPTSQGAATPTNPPIKIIEVIPRALEKRQVFGSSASVSPFTTLGGSPTSQSAGAVTVTQTITVVSTQMVTVGGASSTAAVSSASSSVTAASATVSVSSSSFGGFTSASSSAAISTVSASSPSPATLSPTQSTVATGSASASLSSVTASAFSSASSSDAGTASTSSSTTKPRFSFVTAAPVTTAPPSSTGSATEDIASLITATL